MRIHAVGFLTQAPFGPPEPERCEVVDNRGSALEPPSSLAVQRKDTDARGSPHISSS